LLETRFILKGIRHEIPPGHNTAPISRAALRQAYPVFVQHNPDAVFLDPGSNTRNSRRKQLSG